MRFYAIRCDDGRARKKTARQRLCDLPLQSAEKNTLEDSGAAGGGVYMTTLQWLSIIQSFC